VRDFVSFCLFSFPLIFKEKIEHKNRLKKNKTPFLFSAGCGKEKEYTNNEEEALRRAEEEEEKEERKSCGGGSGGCGAVEAWSDRVVDGIGVAPQGCFRLACDFEIEWDRSVFLFEGEYRESGGACVRRGKGIGITCECSRMYIHFDVGMGVESHALGKER